MNLVEYLARATEFLERHDVTSPRLNAEVLLANMLDITRLDIYTNFERQLTDSEAAEYRDLVVRRSTGVPLQYITGQAGFRGLTLEVREGVFIPRPETELLVEKALETLPEGGEPGTASRVLDIGTGCGCIAVSIASEREGASVVAVDCSEEAVELCGINARSAGVEERVQAMRTDLFDGLDEHLEFDLMVSNPPYIPESMRDALPAEVRDHEPERALFAGRDGLDAIGEIIERAPSYLAPGGWLALEVDESHARTVADSLTEDGWAEVEVFDDLAGKPRIVRARNGE